MSAGDPRISAEASRIRELIPIASGTATEEDCVLLGKLAGEFLEREGLAGSRLHLWHTAQFTTGRIAGRWSASLAEAQLHLEFWWEEQVAWIVPDPGCLVHRWYLPVSSPTNRDKRFPLTDGPACWGDVAPALFDLEDAA